MYNLLPYKIAQILTVGSIELILTAVGIIISFILMYWRIARSHDKDIQTAISGKVDVTELKLQCENRDQKLHTMKVRLEEHEKNNKTQFDSIKDHLEEIKTNGEYVRKKMDNFIDKLYDTRNKK